MKPFLSGRAQVSIAALQSLADTLPPPASPAPGNRPGAAPTHVHNPDSGAGPTVECIRQGDKVVRIVVTCSCGERTEIECLYPAGG